MITVFFGVCEFCSHLRMETEQVSGTLCSCALLEYRTIDKVPEPSDLQTIALRLMMNRMYEWFSVQEH
jgi:hypothetical protein